MSRCWSFAVLLLVIPLCGADPTNSACSPWERGAEADNVTRHEIELAIASVMSWWSEHGEGFKKCRMLPPRAEWRKLNSSRFFTDPKSKGVAYSAWNSDESDYWWAVCERGDRGPWKIGSPQEGGFTFNWTIAVNSTKNRSEIVEVQIVYPSAMVMHLPIEKKP